MTLLLLLRLLNSLIRAMLSFNADIQPRYIGEHVGIIGLQSDRLGGRT